MIIAVDGLTKHFAERRTWGALLRAPFTRAARQLVVDRVTFDVREGEIFGLLGQNGAGKTTIFKMLSTLILADEGDARIAGHDVRDEPAAVRRLLAPVIANERSLNWRLPARENLRLYSALQGLRGRDARAEEERVLAVTGLVDTGPKMVGMFSSGMRQRLLIARALLARPRVLLLDEPTRSLDPISARDFRRFLRETVVQSEGCTVLLATHDADEVWDLCDRVGILERGRLLAVDTTVALRHRAARDHFRLWVHTEDVARASARAKEAGVTLTNTGAAAEEHWTQLECDIAGGAERAAQILALLGADGARIARFERTVPSLAEMIERVVASSAADPGSARA